MINIQHVGINLASTMHASLNFDKSLSRKGNIMNTTAINGTTHGTIINPTIILTVAGAIFLAILFISIAKHTGSIGKADSVSYQVPLLKMNLPAQP
ncbi:MAG: hypothetical protein NTW11_04095 [Candidatus Staskawiczbacteria bacterium]|nr:hypothetical protein [Candidatus Staskawiczbacteria bacterium]